MAGKFYGLGVGPGDPGLITLKAFRILEEVDTLCVPRSSSDRDSLALQVVTGLTGKKYQRLELSFPMSRERTVLEESWAAAGEEVARKVRRGHRVAFVTIGDPMFYSTFGYVLRHLRSCHPDLEVETVPGVTAMSACASLSGVPLAEGEESLAVLPAVYGLDQLEDVLKRFDNVVLMKVNKKVEEVAELLEKLGMKNRAVYFSRCGYGDQYVTADLDSLKGRRLDYMSLLIIKKRGFSGNTGGETGGLTG
ncbi:MAG: precorrin-2 C(20)-methyltransferase [Peptococcaceae bacterium]|nr:precorrin-2 C(20)-methyltransferase [Peptococcaceae bacterium]